MKVYESLRPLSPELVIALPLESRKADWNNNPLPVPLAWSIALDPRTLWFVCALPGGGRSASPRGAFVEGLWEEDVAELFIKSPNGVYQEFNIAPSGAWWSMTLDEYRIRRESARRPEIAHLSTVVKEGRWKLVVAFYRSTLEVAVTPQSLMHVSGMWYREEPCYLSSRPFAGVAPDYHHSGCFETVVMTACPL